MQKQAECERQRTLLQKGHELAPLPLQGDQMSKKRNLGSWPMWNSQRRGEETSSKRHWSGVLGASLSLIPLKEAEGRVYQDGFQTVLEGGGEKEGDKGEREE